MKNKVRLRNTITGKFYGEKSKLFDSWFKDAEVFEQDSPALALICSTFENVEPVEVIDDSKKPVKVSDYRGAKTYKYKGYTISIKRGSKWEKFSKTNRAYCVTRINGEIQPINGVRSAQKTIDKEAATLA